MTYSNLYLTIHDQSKPPVGCGYYYTVTHSAVGHTAFRTKYALKQWLKRTGLKIGRKCSGRTVKLSGSYTRSLDMLNTIEFFAAYGHLEPFFALDNGSYTIGFIEVAEGGNVLHIQNCNTDRPVLDYKAAEAHINYGTRPEFARFH